MSPINVLLAVVFGLMVLALIGMWLSMRNRRTVSELCAKYANTTEHKPPPPGWINDKTNAHKIASEIIRDKMIRGEITIEQAKTHVERGELYVNDYRAAQAFIKANQERQG